MKQSDLDKAIALLDQSPHLTSLRLTLTSTHTITPENVAAMTHSPKLPHGVVKRKSVDEQDKKPVSNNQGPLNKDFSVPC